MDTKKPKIITIASIKGGVGKSTTALMFTNILSKKNNKTLLIDLDPQASSTSFYIKIIKKKNFNPKDINIYKVFKKEIDIENSTIKINDKIDFIASHINLSRFNEESVSLKENLLKIFLSFIQNKYDFIIMDTAPTLGSLLNNSLIVTDYLIIPLTTDQWAIESLDLITSRLQDLFRQDLPIFYLITKFIERQNIDKELKNFIEYEYKDKFLGSVPKRDNLRKTIFYRENFNFNEDYYKAYENILENFLRIISK
ncbi:ParA family protein (plasmid) [Borreliella yangtzensis]|uniref:Cellulose biosynthesis protein BcsQ n=1 Tax=Borreliella yangtzensis TaxID=683292 RepID=A0ABR6PCT6_9SPIR|nr:ParA family protein [Borreliella yangtzensis]MBB6043390.1 cellulose biosynthesis protein BcsQ [Borreliella yangtzensis]WKC72920.1 ParA family protein [Borreliella yangtzensis]WKC73838.1 ParA family protein [Borreliella yangtzensis]